MAIIHATLKVLLILLLLTGITAQTVHAKDYMVEVLIFENLNDSQTTESHHYEPPRELHSEAMAWLLEPSMLLEEANTLQTSSDYNLLHHFSWGQESLPASEAAVYKVVEEQLLGTIKIYAKTLLFANLDLELKGYRMKEKRRIKLNEKHFFDHPKFGVLLQVSRLERPEVEEGPPIEEGVENSDAVN